MSFTNMYQRSIDYYQTKLEDPSTSDRLGAFLQLIFYGRQSALEYALANDVCDGLLLSCKVALETAKANIRQHADAESRKQLQMDKSGA